MEITNGNYSQGIIVGQDVTRKVWELNTNLNCLSDLIITGNYVRQLDTVKNQKKNNCKNLLGSMFCPFRVRCFLPLYFKEKRKEMFLQFKIIMFSSGRVSLILILSPFFFMLIFFFTRE